jgi:hypothetical protein
VIDAAERGGQVRLRHSVQERQVAVIDAADHTPRALDAVGAQRIVQQQGLDGWTS